MIRRPPTSAPFPTRRSSDLARRAEVETPEVLEHGGTLGHRREQLIRIDRDPAVGADEDQIGLRARQQHRLREHVERSEEHTSELQSPDHLVCRLLLEKKNSK